MLNSWDPRSDRRTDQMMFDTDDFLMEALFGVLRVGLARRVVALAFFFLNGSSTEVYDFTSLQCGPSGCPPPFVDIKTKVLSQYSLLIL